MGPHDYRNYKIPKYLIVGLDDEIKSFEEITHYVMLPPIETITWLSEIFYAMIIASDREFNKTLIESALVLCDGEGLYDSPRLDNYEHELVVHAVLKLGNGIKLKMRGLNAYIDGHLPYSLYNIIGKGGVVLQFSDENFN